MSDMKCTQCGMIFKAGVAYGYACPKGQNCGPMEPVKPIRQKLLYPAMPQKPVELPPIISTATDARADALREAAAAVRARYMGDNNREDQEVLRCEAAILELIANANK